MIDERAIHSLRGVSFQEQQATWRDMIRELAPVGYKLMARRGVPMEVREDLLQDSFIALNKNLSQEGFTLSSKLSTYFHAICNHITLAYFRSRKRETSVMEEYRLLAEPETASVPRHFQDEDNLPSVPKIWQEIQALGEGCFKILYLFYAQGKSLDEIARELAYKNVNTVKQAKYKCLSRLKKKFNF